MKLCFYYHALGDDIVQCGGTVDALVMLATTLAEDHEIAVYGDAVSASRKVNGWQLEPFSDDAQTYDDLRFADCMVILTEKGNCDIDKVKCPKVLWNHCWEYVNGAKKYLNKFNGIMGLSETHAAHLGTSHWCYPGGYDTKVFNLGDSIALIDRKPWSMVFCGGDVWYKGKKYATAAADYLAKEGRRTELTIVDGLSEPELATVFRRNQFVLIPSEIESFSLVSVKAQACGCMPVAHNCGGIADTMLVGETGYLYNPNNPFMLAQAILLVGCGLWSSRTPRLAASFVKEHFDAKTVADRFVVQIAELLDG